MHHIAQGCRHQMEISSLDCNNGTENVVRFFGAFADKLDLMKLHFEVITTNTESFEKIHNCFAVEKKCRKNKLDFF